MMIRKLLTAAAVSVALSGAAFADGQDKMYDLQGGYLGLLEIIGDVEDTRGVPYALLEMDDHGLMFYVDREAVYVTLTTDNPIITEQRSFDGFWVSNGTPDEALREDCPADFMRDHLGKEHKLYGNLSWTNTALEDGNLIFRVDLGFCDGPVAAGRLMIRNKPQS